MKKITIELRDCDYQYMRHVYENNIDGRIEEMVRLSLRQEMLDTIDDVPDELQWYLTAMKTDSNFYTGNTESENQTDYEEWTNKYAKY